MNSRHTQVAQPFPPTQPMPLVTNSPPDPKTSHRHRLSSSTRSLPRTPPLVTAPWSPTPGRPNRRSTSSIELAEFSTPPSRPSSPSVFATTETVQVQAPRLQPPPTTIEEPTSSSSSSSSTSSTSIPHRSLDPYATHVHFAQPERPSSYRGRATQTIPHYSTRGLPGFEQHPYSPYVGLNPFIPGPGPLHNPEYSALFNPYIPAPRPIRPIPSHPPVIPPVVPPVAAPFFVNEGQRRPAIRSWMLAASPESPYISQMIGQHGWRQYIHPNGSLYWSSSEHSKPVVSNWPPDHYTMTLVDAQLQTIQFQVDAQQWELYIGTDIHFVHHASRSMSRPSEPFHSFKLRMEQASYDILMS